MEGFRLRMDRGGGGGETSSLGQDFHGEPSYNKSPTRGLARGNSMSEILNMMDPPPASEAKHHSHQEPVSWNDDFGISVQRASSPKRNVSSSPVDFVVTTSSPKQSPIRSTKSRSRSPKSPAASTEENSSNRSYERLHKALQEDPFSTPLDNELWDESDGESLSEGDGGSYNGEGEDDELEGSSRGPHQRGMQDRLESFLQSNSVNHLQLNGRGGGDDNDHDDDDWSQGDESLSMSISLKSITQLPYAIREEEEGDEDGDGNENQTDGLDGSVRSLGGSCRIMTTDVAYEALVMEFEKSCLEHNELMDLQDRRKYEKNRLNRLLLNKEDECNEQRQRNERWSRKVEKLERQLQERKGVKQTTAGMKMERERSQAWDHLDEALAALDAVRSDSMRLVERLQKRPEITDEHADVEIEFTRVQLSVENLEKEVPEIRQKVRRMRKKNGVLPPVRAPTRTRSLPMTGKARSDGNEKNGKTSYPLIGQEILVNPDDDAHETLSLVSSMFQQPHDRRSRSP